MREPPDLWCHKRLPSAPEVRARMYHYGYKPRRPPVGYTGLDEGCCAILDWRGVVIAGLRYELTHADVREWLRKYKEKA